jgi:hypothetical protein
MTTFEWAPGENGGVLKCKSRFVLGGLALELHIARVNGRTVAFWILEDGQPLGRCRVGAA